MSERKTVLVTGASGLIGCAVVKRLCSSEAYKIVAVTSGRKAISFPDGVEVESANLLNEEDRAQLMQRVQPDLMIHLAWGLDNSSFLASEKNIQWLEASLRLIVLFCQNGGKRCLFAGTSSEYGVGFGGNSEEAKSKEFSMYGMCKSSVETIAASYCRQNGVQFASARYFSVYGPGDDRPGRALPTAIQAMMRGETFYCRSPWNVWDYIYVDDAAEGTVRLLESGYCGPLNIASGQPMTMKDAFSVVADVLGRPDLIQYDMTCRTSSILTADCAKAGSVLGNYQKVSFRDGIEKTILWWRDKRD